MIWYLCVYTCTWPLSLTAQTLYPFFCFRRRNQWRLGCVRTPWLVDHPGINQRTSLPSPRPRIVLYHRHGAKHKLSLRTTRFGAHHSCRGDTGSAQADAHSRRPIGALCVVAASQRSFSDGSAVFATSGIQRKLRDVTKQPWLSG